jgi:hypothetical protein
MMDALLRRLERAQREKELMPAQIAACVVNFSMAHPKKPVSPLDFMPSEWAKNPPAEKKPKRRKRQLIATEIRATMDAWLRNNHG